jgi:DNA-binding NarL/FixJ family response regulator
MKITVSIADDHPVVVSGLQKILSEYNTLEILDACSDGEELLSCLAKRQPAVLLLDIQMPGKKGDELATIISESWPGVGILVLTNNDVPFHVKKMLQCGALGYLLKSSSPDTLLKAIEIVNTGKQYIDPQMRNALLEETINARNNTIPQISQREKEILDLIVNECTSHEIAEKLFISYRTVENHRLNLLLKLGVKNTAGLVRKVIQLKLMD